MKKTKKIGNIPKGSIYETPANFFKKLKKDTLKEVDDLESENIVDFPKENIFETPPYFFENLRENTKEATFKETQKMPFRKAVLGGLTFLIIIFLNWLYFDNIKPYNRTNLSSLLKAMKFVVKKEFSESYGKSKDLTKAISKDLFIQEMENEKSKAFLNQKPNQKEVEITKEEIKEISKEGISQYLINETAMQSEMEVIDWVLMEEQAADVGFLDSLEVSDEIILEEIGTENLEEILWEEE